jgi:hypothetical protein
MTQKVSDGQGSAPQIGIDDPIIRRMKKAGIELTAENYRDIATNMGETEWTPEHEASLPAELLPPPQTGARQPVEGLPKSFAERREALIQWVLQHHPALTREEAEKHLDQLG